MDRQHKELGIFALPRKEADNEEDDGDDDDVGGFSPENKSRLSWKILPTSSATIYRLGASSTAHMESKAPWFPPISVSPAFMNTSREEEEAGRSPLIALVDNGILLLTNTSTLKSDMIASPDEAVV